MAKKIELTKEKEEAYLNLRKLAKRANQRLVRLERRYGKNRWGAKDLKSKLEVEPLQAWTKTGRVRVNKSMELNDILIVTKAVEDFLKSNRSKVKEVKKIKKKIVEGFKRKLSSEDYEISDEEAEAIYRTLEDENYQVIYRYIKPSELNSLLIEAKEERENEDEFVDKVIRYAQNGNDENIRNTLENLLRAVYRNNM